MLILSWTKPSIGQTPFSWHYSTENGLSSNTVYCVQQDKNGYLWFGTEQGVCRFNGREFETFSIEDGLTDLVVFQIHEDSKGRIWFLTYNGIPCFFKDGVFHNHENTPFLQQIKPNGFLSSFLETDKGSILISSSMGSVFEISNDNKVNDLGKNHEAFRNRAVLHLWNQRLQPFAINQTLNIVNLDNGLCKPSLIDSVEGDFRFLFHDNALYMSANDSLMVLNVADEVMTSTVIPDKSRVLFLGHGFNPGKIAVGLQDGLHFFDPISKRYSEKFLSGNNISWILPDDRGGLWCSTLGNGVFYAPSELIYTYEMGEDTRLPVFSLATRGDTLWYGADLGNFGYLVDHKMVNRLLETEDNGRARVMNLIPFQGGMIIQVERNFHLVNSEGLNKHIGSGISMSRGPLNKLIMGTLRGLVEIPVKHGQIARMSEEIQIQQRVFDIACLNEQLCLIGTQNGVYKVDLKEAKATAIFPETRSKSVNKLLILPDGRVLVGFGGWGVYVYENENLTQRFDEKNGLASVSVKKMSLDSAGRLWVVGSNGVSYVNRASLPSENWEWKTIGPPNGLPFDRIEDVVQLKNQVFLSHEIGITAIDTLLLRKNCPPPQLQISFLSTSDSTFRYVGADTAYFEIWDEMLVQLDATTLPAQTPVFRYSIDKEDWQDLHGTEVRLFDLKKGHHLLKISVKTAQSDWSQPLTLPFFVKRPFYMSPWLIGAAITLFLSVLVLIIWTFVRSSMRNKPKKASNARDKNDPFIFLKTGTETVKTSISNIQWIKSESNYCKVVTREKTVMVLATLKSFEKTLVNEGSFVRVHRSYLVNLNYLSGYKKNRLHIGDQEIPVGDTYRQAVKHKMEHVQTANS